MCHCLLHYSIWCRSLQRKQATVASLASLAVLLQAFLLRILWAAEMICPVFISKDTNSVFQDWRLKNIFIVNYTGKPLGAVPDVHFKTNFEGRLQPSNPVTEGSGWHGNPITEINKPPNSVKSQNIKNLTVFICFCRKQPKYLSEHSQSVCTQWPSCRLVPWGCHQSCGHVTFEKVVASCGHTINSYSLGLGFFWCHHRAQRRSSSNMADWLSADSVDERSLLNSTCFCSEINLNIFKQYLYSVEIQIILIHFQEIPIYFTFVPFKSFKWDEVKDSFPWVLLEALSLSST